MAMPTTTAATPSIGVVIFSITNFKKNLSISFEDDDDVYGDPLTQGGIVFIIY